MLNVYLTIDVEIWSPGWELDTDSLKRAFETYILGKTNDGEFGLKYQLDIINDAGLTAVCFVEPLFTKATGTAYLRQIVDICSKRGNEIQLHAHPEWLKHAAADFQGIDFSERYLLSQFTRQEQYQIIAEARDILATVTDSGITAFRAGSFAANIDTLAALNQAGIKLDSSYNASMPSPDHGFTQANNAVNAPFCRGGVTEIPMTVYRTHNNSLRHTQIAACTFKELKSLLLKSFDSGHTDVVILSHSAELLDGSRSRKDPRNIETLTKLVSFIAANPDKFRCKVFNDITQAKETPPAAIPTIKLGLGYTMHRVIEKTTWLIQSKF
jgi:hypothetical protein